MGGGEESYKNLTVTSVQRGAAELVSRAHRKSAGICRTGRQRAPPSDHGRQDTDRTLCTPAGHTSLRHCGALDRLSLSWDTLGTGKTAFPPSPAWQQIWPD